ncbi:zinc-binding dehydrogenase [Streptomyces sp. 3N207]|uniref:zinc-binding dehydrogenase n=1 Tax=Streptomyces sp. 3N207 TaxID=3457417 RepID=UPI003FD02BAE
MKAALVVARGGPDCRIVAEHPDPVAGPTDVLIRVRACALNHLDIFVRRGVAGKHVPLPHISGGDIAGEVLSVGSEVTHLNLGERVLVDPMVGHEAIGEDLPGGLAEIAVVPAKNCIKLPDDVDYQTAAALPIAYGTANRMLVTRGRVQAGEVIAVLGASGGVGNAVVLIAKALGCKVIACGSTDAKLERLADIGADVLVNTTTEDFSARIWAETGRQGADVVVDYTGADTWAGSIRATRPGGRVLTCGATSGYDVTMHQPFVWVRELDIIGSNGWRRSDLEYLLDMVRTKKLRPVIDSVLPLDEVQEAERRLEERLAFGKVVVTP